MALEQFLKYAVSDNFYTKDSCQIYITLQEKEIARKNKTEEEKIQQEQNKKNLAVWENHLNHWTDGAIAEYTSYADLRNQYQSGD